MGDANHCYGLLVAGQAASFPVGGFHQREDKYAQSVKKKTKCIFLNLLISSRFKLKTVAVSLSSLRRPKQTMSTTPRQQTLLLGHRNRISAHVSFSGPLWTSLYIEMALLQVTLALPWQPPLAFCLGL